MTIAPELVPNNQGRDVIQEIISILVRRLLAPRGTNESLEVSVPDGDKIHLAVEQPTEPIDEHLLR